MKYSDSQSISPLCAFIYCSKHKDRIELGVGFNTEPTHIQPPKLPIIGTAMK